jgi:hypothetical protein
MRAPNVAASLTSVVGRIERAILGAAISLVVLLVESRLSGHSGAGSAGAAESTPNRAARGS